MRKPSSKLRSHKFHRSWLKFTAVVVGSFGPVFWLAAGGLCQPARYTLDFISFPIDGQPGYDDPAAFLLSALISGFLLGWGAMIWFLSSWVYDKAAEPIRKIVLISLLCWFIFDSSGSVLSGNPWNLLFNTILLLMAVGPLWLPATE